MIRTTVTGTFTLAGFVPASKLDYAYRQRFCRTVHQREKRLGLSMRSPQRCALSWLALALAGIANAQAPAVTETVLQNFVYSSPQGVNPLSGVIRDEEGNLYGTTSSGGANGYGVVYEVNRADELTVLYNFTAVDGAGPAMSGVIRDSDGNLYGTTQSPGSGNFGMVYKLNPAGQETVLYRFTGGADGGCPLV